MSFVGMPGRVPGGYAQAFHISMWITCGFPHGFPQNVDNRENLWITFLIQRPYDSKKRPGFQGLFGAEFSGKNAGYPQVGCFLRGSYPQYPVVCGQVRHKFSRRHAAFPSFLRQNVWNCAQRFFRENFAQREMHRKKGKMWRSGTQKKGLSGFFNGQPLAMRFFRRETRGFKRPGHGRNCRLRLLSGPRFLAAHGDVGGLVRETE